MANYGDVALNLQPDWNRSHLANKKYALWVVGHDNGKSDAYLTDEPDKRHQFAWIAIGHRYYEELAMHLSSGFEFVTKDKWAINEKLWQWNAEEKCFNQGQLLMARPAALWFAQQAERERELSGRKDEDAEEALALAERAGIQVIESPQDRKRARR